jgi:hypothetical protein
VADILSLYELNKYGLDNAAPGIFCMLFEPMTHLFLTTFLKRLDVLDVSWEMAVGT